MPNIILIQNTRREATLTLTLTDGMTLSHAISIYSVYALAFVGENRQQE